VAARFAVSPFRQSVLPDAVLGFRRPKRPELSSQPPAQRTSAVAAAPHGVGPWAYALRTTSSLRNAAIEFGKHTAFVALPASAQASVSRANGRSIRTGSPAATL